MDFKVIVQRSSAHTLKNLLENRSVLAFLQPQYTSLINIKRDFSNILLKKLLFHLQLHTRIPSVSQN